MIDFSAYLAAQHVTREAVCEALPDAPIRSDDSPAARRSLLIALRQRLSFALRLLADRLEPIPEPSRPAVAGCN